VHAFEASQDASDPPQIPETVLESLKAAVLSESGPSLNLHSIVTLERFDYWGFAYFLKLSMITICVELTI
jgi:hypothetical protein